MKIENLILPLGITTYLFLCSTIYAGLRKAPLKRHHLLASLTFIAASLHASLVIYLKLTK